MSIAVSGKLAEADQETFVLNSTVSLCKFRYNMVGDIFMKAYLKEMSMKSNIPMECPLVKVNIFLIILLFV